MTLVWQLAGRRLRARCNGTMCRLWMLFLCSALTACGTQEVRNVTPETLYPRLGSDEEPLLLDVRSEYEYRSGHIPGAIHFPFWKAPWNIARVQPLPGQDVVVYCEHGPRASMAGAVLKRAGVKRVLYLKGHMSAWRKASLPMQATERP